MTDAAEAAFSPPTPPSRCSRRAPCPRPPCPPPPPGSRASPRPLPTALRARVGPGARAGRARARARVREGGGRGGRPASSRDPRSLRPSPGREPASAGRGRGAGQGARGGPAGSFPDVVLGQLGETLPLGRGAVLLPGPAKVADFTAKLREARQDRTGEGPGGPAWMGTRDEEIRLWVALGHDVWTLPCQCLAVCCLWLF
ncbi:Hypothetical predicted protein [Lynx pardinus]|uniref:Uncharacterized protein n=1 Tax=Lynx pardinus TaxID=191816 RepID=A0A485ND99_LYNPA|nr:Hypothetical predicted protein [Lynx pardinus]